MEILMILKNVNWVLLLFVLTVTVFCIALFNDSAATKEKTPDQYHLIPIQTIDQEPLSEK